MDLKDERDEKHAKGAAMEAEAGSNDKPRRYSCAEWMGLDKFFAEKIIAAKSRGGIAADAEAKEVRQSVRELAQGTTFQPEAQVGRDLLKAWRRRKANASSRNPGTHSRLKE